MSKEKVVGYIRVSTQTQVEEGFGLAAQMKAIIDLCEKNDHELVEVFRDEGTSGTVLNRPGLISMLERLKTDGIKKVITKHTSRLWRDDRNKVEVTEALMALKADIVSVDQPTYSLYEQKASTWLANEILGKLDEYDRRSINEKLAEGRKTKALSGDKPAGSAPIGYKWKYTEEGKPYIAVDVTARQIVIDIFIAYSKIKSVRRVRELINEHGYRTKRGKDFSDASVRNILKNDFYIGIVTHDGQKVQGNHQSIIEIDLFNEVQKILERNNKRKAQ